MANFIHIAPAKALPHVRRVGVKACRVGWPDVPRGVFLTPATPDYDRTHQWVRELRRRERGPLAAVDVRVPDDEPVWFGHYGGPHAWATAAEACGRFLRYDDPRGWEVILPRRVAAKEVRRARPVRPVVGWRAFPNAKGKPWCRCDWCTRGQRGAGRLRRLRRLAGAARP